jgi:hypothetical protein
MCKLYSKKIWFCIRVTFLGHLVLVVPDLIFSVSEVWIPMLHSTAQLRAIRLL